MRKKRKLLNFLLGLSSPNSPNSLKASALLCLTISLAFSVGAHAGTVCIEPDGSHTMQTIDFYQYGDKLDWIPFGTVFSNFTHKTECVQNPKDRAIARNENDSKWVQFVVDGNLPDGGKDGYYRMQPAGDSVQFVYQREYVYEFLKPKMAGQNRAVPPDYAALNADPTDDQKITMFNYSLGVNFNYSLPTGSDFASNWIRLLSWDESKQAWISVSTYVDNKVVQSIGPGVYQIDSASGVHGENLYLSKVSD